ncbi:Porin [Bartonella apis]
MVILKKFGLQNDSYRWLYHVNLRFHLASETQPGCLKTYVELCSEWQDDSNSSSTSVRYGGALLSGLRTGVDEPLFTSWSGYFGYVYNDNINASSSRSISRGKVNDNLMIEELFNHDNFDAAAILSVL